MNSKDLAGAIIHDLKNQLHSVLMEGEKAYEDIPAEYQAVLTPLLARTRRVHQDAMQLVTLYRLQERGNFPADDAWPADTIHHAIECFRTHFPDVVVSVDVAADCQGYYNDSLMQMAFANLMNNSAQAGATDIRIHAEEEGSGLMIRFEDNGPGFQEDVLNGDRDSDKEGGSGMGLFFTELIVHHHSQPSKPAEMRLSNGDDDQGAVVTLHLP